MTSAGVRSCIYYPVINTLPSSFPAAKTPESFRMPIAVIGALVFAPCRPTRTMSTSSLSCPSAILAIPILAPDAHTMSLPWHTMEDTGALDRILCTSRGVDVAESSPNWLHTDELQPDAIACHACYLPDTNAAISTRRKQQVVAKEQQFDNGAIVSLPGEQDYAGPAVENEDGTVGEAACNFQSRPIRYDPSHRCGVWTGPT